MLLDAPEKPRPWAASLVQAVLLSLLLLGLLALPGTPVLQRMGERLAVMDGSRDLRPLAARQQPELRLASGAPAPLSPRPPAPEPPPPPPPSSCKLNVKHAVFARTCKLLQDVCVDQGRIILYGKEYQPLHSNGPPRNLPDLSPSRRQRAVHFPYWHSDNKDIRARLQAIPVRPASSREPRQYLANPAFSNCTVPIVVFRHNSFNYAHDFRDNAARMYSALAETPWADHARLVLVTGEGLPVSPMSLSLWQPLSKLRVTSWAEFSIRLPDRQVGAGSQQEVPGSDSQLPPSFEGTEQRCFRHMYVCLEDVQPQSCQLQGYGQHLARYYDAPRLVQSMPQLGPPTPMPLLRGRQQAGKKQAAPVLPPPVSLLHELWRGAGLGPGEHELRVMFSKRSSNDRQLLNAAELVQQCNRWRYTARTGEQLRALCWEVETPTLAAGIAAAQQADILIGAHGANLANGFLLRPGSSVIELTMHEFEELGGDTAHANFAKRNFADPGAQLQWWKILLCDEGSWTPGLKETVARRKGTTIAKDASKYRNLIVRWEALSTALEAVVDTAGDMEAYRDRVVMGRWWWLSTNSSTVYAGPDLYQTCQKARQQGIID